ncbi:AfsR/SARP family transcriptional regulator [Amycolatopsis nigrescens]|uniref:AfsR/SARP family transcriptional regulator n=1 Tax=Amycolatopsis nigrescens TaxID=381445 RepID=UPI00036B08ED|nr:BTAD domain-containing putative transcriptional regulator [Amycolatopsis nigrescens]
MTAVEFRVLGDIEARVGDRPMDLGHARQRCVLVSLLIEANKPVSADQLLERIWGDRLPHRARGTLYSYLSRLRQVLESAEGVGIIRRSGGYVLVIEPEAVDLHRFHRLVAQARDGGDEHRALDLFGQALRLWRGEAFAGLDSPWLSGVRGTLERERLAAELDRNDLELKFGRHTDLLSGLSASAEAHPLDERLAGQLMLALYRCGRQADALEVFRSTRRRLAGELGIDPGPELTGLHQRILRGDEDLATPATRGPTGRNDLPGDIGDFTGRGAEVDRLLAAVAAGTGGSAMTVSIDGMAGVGKTTLAVHAARLLAGRYPDAQLFITLHGQADEQRPTDPLAALGTLLDAIGVPDSQIPDELEARSALWRAKLADRAALVVLDNVADAAQVRALLPGTANCLTLITSRRRLVDLEASCVVSLDVLSSVDAVALFTGIVGAERADAEPGVVAEAVELCGRLPLAIRIAASRLRTRPSWTVRRLADRLRKGQRRLAELAAGDRSVAAAFTLSYKHLSAGQQRLFRLLGLHRGPDIDPCAAAALADVDVYVAEDLLQDLVDVHLLQEPVSGRYQFHDLLREHAKNIGREIESEAEQEAALARVVDYYLHTAYAGERLMNPHAQPIELARPAPGCAPFPLTERAAARVWFDTEHGCLLAQQQLAAEHGWHAKVWQLAWVMSTFHLWRGHRLDDLTMWQAGLEAAERIGDPVVCALAHRYLGSACQRAGRPVEALEHLRRSLALAEQIGNVRAQATAHRYLAVAWAHQGDEELRARHINRALRLFQDLGDPSAEADLLNAMGWHDAQLGNYQSARRYCERALELNREHPNGQAEAATLDSLGHIAHHTGEHAEALGYLGDALVLFREAGNIVGQAIVLTHLGETQVALGHVEQARQAWGQALDLYQTQHRTQEPQRRLRDLLSTLDQQPDPPGAGI